MAPSVPKPQPGTCTGTPRPLAAQSRELKGRAGWQERLEAEKLGTRESREDGTTLSDTPQLMCELRSALRKSLDSSDTQGRLKLE